MQRREPRPFAGDRGRPGVASGADALSRRPGKPDSARRRRSPRGIAPGPDAPRSTTRRTGLGSPVPRRRPDSATGPGTLRRRPRERDATRLATGDDRMARPAPDALPRQRERRPLIGRPEPPGGASGPAVRARAEGAASSVSLRSQALRPSRTPSAGAPVSLQDTTCPDEPLYPASKHPRTPSGGPPLHPAPARRAVPSLGPPRPGRAPSGQPEHSRTPGPSAALPTCRVRKSGCLPTAQIRVCPDNPPPFASPGRGRNSTRSILLPPGPPRSGVGHFRCRKVGHFRCRLTSAPPPPV